MSAGSMLASLFCYNDRTSEPKRWTQGGGDGVKGSGIYWEHGITTSRARQAVVRQARVQ